MIGRRSSGDDFFVVRYEYQDGQRVEIRRSPEEIDEESIIGSAISNGLANGISRILGLRNLTWEELQAAGIQPKQRVAYDGKKQPSTNKPEQEEPEIPNEINGFLEAVTTKSGKDKKGKDWVKFGL